ncbi:MAG: ATP-binding protein, partial [Elsteraceae bacterium]
MAGRPAPIDTSGDDELTDMALALEHFVLTIEANERNLRVAREAADDANQAKSAFLAAMSHEIRTPMNGVTTMAELLIRTRLNDEQKSIAQVIIDSGVSLLAIINDILDFSKIEAGKIDLEWVDADVASVVDGVGRLLEARATERGLQLQVDIDPALPALLRVDPTRLRQILLNLVGNAIKFTEVGRVTLAVQALGPAVEGEATRVRFAVTDTGIGLTPEQKSRLFKPFSQADGSITRRFGGTGLGLSICKRLTEMMDGAIDVDSEAGVGSTFHFTLSLTVVAIERSAARTQAETGAPAAWKEWDAPDREIAAAQGARLLAADDNPTNRLVLAALFDRLGYVVDLVKDGEEAWTALQEGRYGLLLTDCHMPNLDGFALTRRLREAEADGSRPDRLPIVALT